MDSLIATLLDLLLLGIGKAALCLLRKLGVQIPELSERSTTVLGALLLAAAIALIVITIKHL